MSLSKDKTEVDKNVENDGGDGSNDDDDATDNSEHEPSTTLRGEWHTFPPLPRPDMF